MAVSLKHKFASAKTDGGDTSLVRPSNWNAEHDLLIDANKIVGRTTAGTGSAEEIGVSSELTLAGGTLGVASSLGGKDFTGPSTIVVNSTSDALRVTQTGTGNAFVVEDSASTDATPFVINQSGIVISGHTGSVQFARSQTTTSGSNTTAGIQAVSSATGASQIGTLYYGSSTAGAKTGITLARTRSSDPTTKLTLASGDTISGVDFVGDNGTDYYSAALITGAVDGTPSSDMPGRLVFSTTASGASTPTERMRIDSAGQVGIGSAPVVGRTFTLGKAITGATTAYSGFLGGTIQSDVTTTAYASFTFPSTAAASFTLNNLVHYAAAQGAIGAGSFVTTQYGFQAANTIVGAANNFGFRGDIAAGVSRTITNVELTSNVVTVTTSVAHGYLAGQSVTVSATTNTAINGTYTIASVPTTTTLTYARTSADIASTADTGTTVIVGRFNFYAAGTAPNYFAGRILVGSTTSYTNAASNFTPQIQVSGLSNDTTGFSFNNWSNVAGRAGVLAFNKSKSNVIGTQGVVASGDTISQIIFTGDDGVDFKTAASITAFVDGTPGTNDMPGRIVLSTTADGAATPSERMRIDSTGAVGIGTTSLGALYGLRVTKTLIGSTGSNIFSSATASSSTTTNLYSFRSSVATAANSGTPYTVSNVYGYAADQGTFNADSTVSDQFGFFAGSALTGATNNYGFYGLLAAGTGRWNFYAAGTADNYFAGNLGIATSAPTQKLDINDDSIRVRTAKTPASATATGTQGQIAWDADYVYVCVATNTWKRSAITTW